MVCEQGAQEEGTAVSRTLHRASQRVRVLCRWGDGARGRGWAGGRGTWKRAFGSPSAFGSRDRDRACPSRPSPLALPEGEGGSNQWHLGAPAVRCDRRLTWRGVVLSSLQRHGWPGRQDPGDPDTGRAGRNPAQRGVQCGDETHLDVRGRHLGVRNGGREHPRQCR